MELNNNSLVSLDSEDSNSSGQNVNVNLQKTTFSSYDHGFTNGAYAIEKEPFERYLTHYHEIEETERLINHKRIQLRDYRNTKESSSVAIQKLQNEQIEVMADLAKQESLYNDAANWLNEIRQSITNLKQELKLYLDENPTDYKLFAAVMFLSFAFIFMLADFGIATLVADTMGITGWEKYLYAAGLAGLSIMLKPVYDRLLEKHFVKKQRIKYYNWFVISSALLVLILLVSLGYFRMSTMEALKSSESVSTSISTGNPEQNNFNPASSAIGIISFVLSSVMFAVASAICLGIAIPVLHKERKQQRDKKTKTRLESQASHKEGIVADLNREMKFSTSKLQVISTNLTLANQEMETINKYDSIIAALEQLYIKLFQQKGALSKALFQDGYLRGGRIAELKGDIGWILEREINRQKVSEDGGNVVDLENITVRQDVAQQGELSRTRPYLAIRKMIAKDLRDKFNNNDESIEVYG